MVIIVVLAPAKGAPTVVEGVVIVCWNRSRLKEGGFGNPKSEARRHYGCIALKNDDGKRVLLYAPG